MRALAPGRRTYALAFTLLVLGGLQVAAMPARAATGRGSGGAAIGALPAPDSGGGVPPAGVPIPTTPLPTAQISPDGRTAIPPAGAPLEVKNAIAAANQITTKPYRYGGGHRRWKDRGYDCSGSVSYALHGGGLLTSPLPSTSFMRWGLPGPRPVGHGLLEPRARLPDDRGAPLRHLGPRRARTALAKGGALEPDVPRAAPRRLLGACPKRPVLPCRRAATKSQDSGETEPAPANAGSWSAARPASVTRPGPGRRPRATRAASGRSRRPPGFRSRRCRRARGS